MNRRGRAAKYLPTPTGRAMAIVDQIIADTLAAGADWVDHAAVADAIEADRHVLREAADRAGDVPLDPEVRRLVLSTLRTRARTTTRPQEAL